MKIRYLVSMGSVDKSYTAFEKDNKGEFVFYDVTEYEAVTLIDAGIAIAEKETEYKKAKDNFEKNKAEKEVNDRLIRNLAIKDDLVARKEVLEAELSQINDDLEQIEKETKGIKPEIVEDETIEKEIKGK